MESSGCVRCWRRLVRARLRVAQQGVDKGRRDSYDAALLSGRRWVPPDSLEPWGVLSWLLDGGEPSRFGRHSICFDDHWSDELPIIPEQESDTLVATLID